MKFKISCSFGEIVDKVTILNIKKNKTKDTNKLLNINKELNSISCEVPLLKNKDSLFNELSKINKRLWELEDKIREKSKKREFDKEYILYAELIHKTNDKRYLVKREINIKYNSDIKEEKIYNNKIKIIDIDNVEYDLNDMKRLEIGKKFYTDGYYNESLKCIENIMDKYKNNTVYDSFLIDLLFSYSNICNIFNKSYPYFNRLLEIINNLNRFNISDEQKIFCCFIFATLCLSKKKYEISYNYIRYVNYISGPNINCENMSFFNNNDKDKTLLIYDGGGLGDKIMLSRFIPKLCNDYKDNNIIFLTNDRLIWFFNKIFKNLSNLRIISDKTPNLIGKINYHCSLLSLIKYFNITYDKIYTIDDYKNFDIKISNECKKIISSFTENTYIINWKGNPNNMHEKSNRMMDLKNAIPLFMIDKINWIVINKDINKQEIKILKKYNVKYYGNIIDKDKAFYDTISILRNVKGIISTDTSLPHLSLSMGIKTFVLLTLGCEWRWTQDKITNWYPNAVLLRQNKLSDWEEPINQLIKLIS
jgi:hypothetical protein